MRYFLLVVTLFATIYLSAQESCYEQYFREHNKKILTVDDADDSTYVADVHVALVDSTWYMWLSVDPLADKYPGNTPYMYCNGNPIMLIDPDGRAWTDADGNEIKDHSPIRAYIFYNPEEFTPQTKAMYERLEKQYGRGAVALSDVTTETEFVQDWSDMKSRKIAEVNINHHGNNQTLILNPTKGEYITSTGNGKSNFHSRVHVEQKPVLVTDSRKILIHNQTGFFG